MKSFAVRFQFEGADRLVRVAAVSTAARWYTEPFLNEINSYGSTLNPADEPDVIAVTTYCGNGITIFMEAINLRLEMDAGLCSR